MSDTLTPLEFRLLRLAVIVRCPLIAFVQAEPEVFLDVPELPGSRREVWASLRRLRERGLIEIGEWPAPAGSVLSFPEERRRRFVRGPAGWTAIRAALRREGGRLQFGLTRRGGDAWQQYEGAYWWGLRFVVLGPEGLWIYGAGREGLIEEAERFRRSGRRMRPEVPPPESVPRWRPLYWLPRRGGHRVLISPGSRKQALRTLPSPVPTLWEPVLRASTLWYVAPWDQAVPARN